jgi:hypothetical protein
MLSRVRIAVVVWTAVVLGAAGVGHVMDCDGRIVSMGATPGDVQTICGDPVQVNDTIEVVLKPNGVKLSSNAQLINEWRALRCHRVGGSWSGSVCDGAG